MHSHVLPFDPHTTIQLYDLCPFPHAKPSELRHFHWHTLCGRPSSSLEALSAMLKLIMTGQAKLVISANLECMLPAGMKGKNRLEHLPGLVA
eukprot:1158935-Pelagomonas_calceolata.AAC.2